MEIGEDVLISRLYSPILKSENNPALETFDIISIKIGLTASGVLPSNISIQFNELATLLKEDIVINYV